MGKIIKTSMKIFYGRMADFLCLASSLHIFMSILFEMSRHDIMSEVYKYIALFGFVAAGVFFVMSLITKK